MIQSFINNKQLVLRKSTRAKRVALRFDTKKHHVVLVVPQRVSEKRALSFALEHQAWIKEQLKKQDDIIPFTHGTKIPVLGLEREIVIETLKTRKVTDITLHEDQILVQTNLGNPQKRIERFFRKTAKEEIKKRATEKAQKIHKRINTIRITDTKSRWGSCSYDGNLSFSYRLLFSPIQAFDYVIGHEVAHLVHMNHSRDFWALCKNLCDDFETGHQWMKENGHRLMLYGASPAQPYNQEPLEE